MPLTPNCKPPIKPVVVNRPSPLYGFPRGVIGRDENEIQGILIHCVKDLSNYLTTCSISGPLGRPRGAAKASVHYGVPIKGFVQQYVADTDTAWGLSPSLAQGATVPTYPECYENLTWDLADDNPGISPDRYLIHIAVEFPKERAREAMNPNGDCGCHPGFDEGLSVEQSNNLVHLLAYLAAEHNLTINVNTINFLHRINDCNQPECGCDPDIISLLIRVEDYCETPDKAKDGSYAPGDDVDFILGEDEYGQKRKIALEDFANLLGGAVALVNINAVVGGTTILDLSAGRIQVLNMGAGNTTLTAINVPIGEIIIFVVQDAVGERTVTWNSVFKFSDADQPLLTSYPNAIDLFRFVCNGTSCFLSSAVYNLS